MQPRSEFTWPMAAVVIAFLGWVFAVILLLHG
jgi:hypothetical protein